MKNKLIGLYQLVTGIYGAILCLYELIIQFGDDKQDVEFIQLLGIVLFAGVAYAGYALLNKIRDAKKWSIIAQAVQTVSISTGSFVYLFTASAFASLVFPSDKFIHTQVQTIAFEIGSYGASQEIHIYFMPIVLLVLLFSKK